MKKVSVQQLADSLNLSRVTVWKALNNRPGVAPETARRICEKAKSLEMNPLLQDEIKPQVQTVALAASKTNLSSFWIETVDKAASELRRKGISLNYLPIDTMDPQAEELSEIVRQGNVSGLIVLNAYDEKLIDTLQAISLPKVFFDTIPGHTTEDLQGDLVLLDGQQTIRKITEKLIGTGCRRIGFIGDIVYAETNRLRWNGFAEAMQMAGFEIEPEICLTGSMEMAAYQKNIGTFLDGISEMPDAFVCVNDFVAFIVMNLLAERGFQIPQDIMLSGYDHSREFLLDSHGIITTDVQTDLLGKRLVAQLLYRIENPAADFEEIKIIPKIACCDF